MGTVYSAKTATGTSRAIKLVHPHLVQDEFVRRRFLREARLLEELEHPGIVRFYYVGEHEHGEMPLVFMAMELLQGRTLRRLLDSVAGRGAAWSNETASLIRQLLDSLAYVHRLGAAHRDIKPSNVFITSDGWLKLIDFGLAYALESEFARITQHADPMGTVAYLAPELLDGGAVLRSIPRMEQAQLGDVYAAGLCLYEILAGEHPFEAAVRSSSGHVSLGQLARCMIEGEVPDLAQRRPDLPEGVHHLVARALQRDPQRRFASAVEMLDALQDTVAEARPGREVARDLMASSPVIELPRAREEIASGGAESSGTTGATSLEDQGRTYFQIPDLPSAVGRAPEAAEIGPATSTVSVPGPVDKVLKRAGLGKIARAAILVAAALILFASLAAAAAFALVLPRVVDGNACEASREANSVEVWREYRRTRPAGSCIEEAGRAVEPLLVGPREEISSVADAIERAAEGQRILVAPGTYRENLVLSRTVLLEGDAAEDVVIAPRRGPAVTVLGGSPVLSGLGLQSASGEDSLVISGGDPLVERCAMTSVAVTAGTPLIQDSVIASSDATGVGVSGGDVRIVGCEIHGHGRSGVDVSDGASIALSRSQIHDNGEMGIHLVTGSQGSIHDNTIRDNGAFGVAIASGADPTVYGNTIHGTGFSGISVFDEGKGTVRDNEIHDNGGCGVSVVTGGAPRVESNHIHDNGYYGVEILDGGAGTYIDNDIKANRSGAWHVESGSPAERSGNRTS